jgi:hypothetical protein
MKLVRTRARLDRAEMHYREFGKIWNSFLSEGDPYHPRVQVYPNGEGVINVEPAAVPRERLALEFGEMLYQLRAALDSLVYEVAIRDSRQDPPPNAENLEFPVRRSQASFKNAAAKIAPLSELHREMIESIQPYDLPKRTEGQRVTAETLDLLNDLARKDRHRGLRIVASWGSNRNPAFDLPSGCSLAWLRVTPDGPLEHESEVARFKINGWRVGLEMYANPNLAIDVAVEDAPPPRSDEDTLNSRARRMIAVVSVVIEGFEKTLS